jgi:hypothetical protein
MPLSDLVPLYTRRGRAYELTGRHAEAETNYQTLEDLAAAAGDQHQTMAARVMRTTLYVTHTALTNKEKAEPLLQALLKQAQASGDQQVEVRALWNWMLMLN